MEAAHIGRLRQRNTAVHVSQDPQPRPRILQSGMKRNSESAGTYDDLALDTVQMLILHTSMLLLFLASVLLITPMCDLFTNRDEDTDREVKLSASTEEISSEAR